jgi:hypothetical protein
LSASHIRKRRNGDGNRPQSFEGRGERAVRGVFHSPDKDLYLLFDLSFDCDHRHARRIFIEMRAWQADIDPPQVRDFLRQDCVGFEK